MIISKDKERSYISNDENGYNNDLKDISMTSNENAHSDHHHDTDDNIKHYKSQILKLKRELSILKEERDEVIKKLDNANRDIDEMKKASSEIGRIKASYEHLKQDHESLRISLESSERIRKQQKELINLLQRSHSVADLSSVVSYNSISTNATPIDSKSISSNITFSSSALAAENRPWLNNYGGSVNKINNNNDSLHIGVAEIGIKNKKKVKKSKSDTIPALSMLATASKSIISASNVSASKQRKEMSRLSSGASVIGAVKHNSNKKQITNRKIISNQPSQQPKPTTIMASRRQALQSQSLSTGRPPRYPKSKSL